MTKDPQVIASLGAGDNSIEAPERLQNYKAALQRIAEQAFALPMFTYSMNYAFTSDLVFKPYPDEIPRFFEARWK